MGLFGVLMYTGNSVIFCIFRGEKCKVDIDRKEHLPSEGSMGPL